MTSRPPRRSSPLCYPHRTASLVLLLGFVALVLSCAPPRGSSSPAPAPTSSADTAASPSAASADDGPVPIGRDSPRWGSENAPITIVEFSDLECPFCARVQPTLTALEERYGPGQLRLVWKHTPLPFHRHARPAALASEAVRQLGGDAAFFRFVTLLLRDQTRLAPEDLRRAAASVGVDAASFELLSHAPGAAARVDADLDLAEQVGANGTPHFLINGIAVSGAVPLDHFVEVIDGELAETRALLAKGVPPAGTYVARSTSNFQAPAKPAREELASDKLAWNVPVVGSPRQGPDDALVTIVQFSDFECPFCKRVQPTLAAVRERYGRDVRIVWKHLPLPFHRHARAAATLSIEARKTLGDAGFFKAVDLVFESSPSLETDDLERVAGKLGLDWDAVSRAIAGDADAAILVQDEGTSIDFEARGTPHFFINGQRLSGAQPLDAFTAVIDAKLAEARALVERGIPRARVFDEVMRSAASPPAPEQKTLPAPTAQNPSRGPSNAKITIQMFADFECPYCRRAMKTMEELEKRHPQQIRLVYRNLPLEFHTGARLGAAAALEAYAQRGSNGFWKMAGLLEADQDDRAPLTRDDLRSHAKTVGLDVARFERALNEGRHEAAIDADVSLATSLGIQGTPSFVVNGYYVPGAQPLAVFERAIARTLGTAAAQGATVAK
jgi:protein-disulfide isomerase